VTDVIEGWVSNAKLVLAELKAHGKRLDSLDNKLDNHVTTIEHRLTKIETNYKNIKWLLSGILFSLIILIVTTVIHNYVG